jgi:DNA-binding NarL/FixJ family response regulator
MPAPKEGKPKVSRHAVLIATVGIVIHARHYREAVSAAFRGVRDLLAVDLGDGGEDALPRTARVLPDAILLDLPEESLLGLIRRLSLAFPQTRLIAMNRLETEEELLPLFEEGIAGFVPRDATLEEILATVRDVLSGELRCPPRIVAALAHRLHTASHRETPAVGQPTLTPRQAQIVHLLEEGMTNKQIAERLGIEFSTVKNHVHRLLKKLAVHRRQQAVGLPAPAPPRFGIVRGATLKKRDHRR